MKKRSLIILTLVLALTLTACGGEEDLVEVKLPNMVVSQVYGDMSKDDVKEIINEEAGIKDAKLKDDGSLEIHMTKEAHDELVKGMDLQVKTFINELKESPDIPFVKDIKYTKDYKEITVIVDKKEYGDNEEIGTFLAGMIGGGVGAYQSYSNKDLGSTIIIEDESGGEISKVKYPDDLTDLLGL